MQLKAFLTSKFVKNGLLFAGASFIVSVIHYAFNLLAAQLLSLADYGEYMTAMSYSFLLGIPMSALSLAIIQRMGKAAKDEKLWIGLAIGRWLQQELKVWLPVAILGAFGLGALILWKGNISLASVLFVFVISLLTLWNVYYLAVLQGMKWFWYASLVIISTALVKVSGAGTVIFVGADLPYLYFAIMASVGFSILVSKWLITKNDVRKQKSQPTTAEAIFKPVRHYFQSKAMYVPLITTFGLIGLSNIDLILVRSFFSPEESGLYASLALMGKIILYLTTPVVSVAYAFFADQTSEFNDQFLLFTTSVIFALVGFVAVVGYRIFPELIVGLIFGEKYLVLTPFLFISAIYGSLYSLVTLYAQYFVSKQTWWGALTVLAMLCQILIVAVWHPSIVAVLQITSGLLFLLVLLYILIVRTNQPAQTS